MANRLSATDDRREFPGIFYYTGGVDLCQCISCFSGDFPLFFACFGPENYFTVPNQHHTFSDLREEPGNTGPSPLSLAFFHIHSKTACRGALATCSALPRRSRLPPRPVLGSPHRGAAPEAAAETKSFCPCHKTGENTGFSPVFFFHVLHGFGVHLGSDTGFSHQVLSVSNRSHPLQHPKRTRLQLFSPEIGCVSLFLPSFDLQKFRAGFSQTSGLSSHSYRFILTRPFPDAIDKDTSFSVLIFPHRFWYYSNTWPQCLASERELLGGHKFWKSARTRSALRQNPLT